MNRKEKIIHSYSNEGTSLFNCVITRKIETDITVLNSASINEKTKERATDGMEVEKAC